MADTSKTPPAPGSNSKAAKEVNERNEDAGVAPDDDSNNRDDNDD